MNDLSICQFVNDLTIQVLGMYLLGDAAWAVIQPSLLPTTTWQSFKQMVEAQFGLSHSQQTYMLYQTVPHSGESMAQFV